MVIIKSKERRITLFTGVEGWKMFEELFLFTWLRNYIKPKRNDVLKLQFRAKEFYKKGEILTDNNCELLILRTYPMNWWRHSLKKLGLRLKNENLIKLKVLQNG